MFRHRVPADVTIKLPKAKAQRSTALGGSAQDFVAAAADSRYNPRA